MSTDSTTPLLGADQSSRRRGSPASLAKQPSYKASQADDGDGGDGGSNKCSELVFKLLGLLMTVLTFAPIFLGLFIEDMRIAATAAMVTSLFNNFFAFVMHRLGKTVSWPKPLDVILFTLFLIQTVSVWAFRESNEFWRMWGGATISFGQSAGVALFWFVLGRPFTRPFVEDDFGRVGATHPYCRFGIRVTSGIWLAAFLLAGAVGVPAGVLYSRGTPSEAALRASAIGTQVVFGVAFALSFPVLRWYMNNYEDAIFDRYKEEIMEWMDKYPDEKFSLIMKEAWKKKAEEADYGTAVA